jgi:flagellar biogenesis protein FliO
MSGTGTGVASYGDLLVTSLVVLVGVCIAAFVIVRVFGRVLATGRVRGAHLLDVVARVPLEPRRSLYVVEVAGKTLLLGTSEMGLSVLSELDGNEVRARVIERPTFGELVKQAWAKRKGLTRPGVGHTSHVGRDHLASTGARDADAPHVGRDASEGMRDAADTSHVGRDQPGWRDAENTSHVGRDASGVRCSSAPTSAQAEMPDGHGATTDKPGSGAS